MFGIRVYTIIHELLKVIKIEIHCTWTNAFAIARDTILSDVNLAGDAHEFGHYLMLLE